MRIARFAYEEKERLGIVDSGGEKLRELPPEANLLELLALDPEKRARKVEEEAGAELLVSEVHLRAPLEPRSLRDFITFEEHIEGTRMRRGATVPEPWFEIPAFYFSNPVAVVGAYDAVEMPPGCKVLDFELEVAVIVASDGSNLAPDQTWSCIGGYTILNDWSARDLQLYEQQIGLGPAKGKDFATTLGPWIVTPDELEPYRCDDRLQLELEVFLNGEKVGDDTLANMAWSFGELLVYASRGTRVVPGDVLGSGTCGSGCLLEIWGRRGQEEPPPLAPGDVVTMRVQGIGTIENRVVKGPQLIAVPRARRPRRRARNW